MSTATQIVTFRLGADLFASDIFAVERVLRYQPPTAVPGAPPWLEGIVEYQGHVVPVISLRRRFELSDAEASTDTRLLVFTLGDEWIAAVVDAVLDVSALDPATLAPPPPLFRGLSATYVRGIVRRDARLVIVLDVARLLSTEERITLAEATVATSAEAA